MNGLFCVRSIQYVHIVADICQPLIYYCVKRSFPFYVYIYCKYLLLNISIVFFQSTLIHLRRHF